MLGKYVLIAINGSDEAAHYKRSKHWKSVW